MPTTPLQPASPQTAPETLADMRIIIDLGGDAAREEQVAAAMLNRLAEEEVELARRVAREKLIGRSPVTRVRRPRVGVDRDGMRALLVAAEASSPRDHALMALLCLNGLRISEALGADVTDLGHEREHRTLRLLRKGGKGQTVALPPRAAEAVDQLVAGRDHGPIFATTTGRRVDRLAAAKTVAHLARVAGIKDHVSPHRLRHGWVTLALDAGVAIAGPTTRR